MNTEEKQLQAQLLAAQGVLSPDLEAKWEVYQEKKRKAEKVYDEIGHLKAQLVQMENIVKSHKIRCKQLEESIIEEELKLFTLTGRDGITIEHARLSWQEHIKTVVLDKEILPETYRRIKTSWEPNAEEMKRDWEASSRTMEIPGVVFAPKWSLRATINQKEEL